MVASAQENARTRISRRRKMTEGTYGIRTSLGSQVLEPAESLVAREVPPNRGEEIRRFLELFGYKPESSILQIHIAGYMGRGRPTPKELVSREKSAERYGGRTFTVVGRTHDPSIADRVIKPRKKREEASSGYIGYLFKDKDAGGKPPDELLPLDFTPAGFAYPADWKGMFATRGFLVALHVPSDFARNKNELARKVRQIGKSAGVKQEWDFLEELEQYGYSGNRNEQNP